MIAAGSFGAAMSIHRHLVLILHNQDLCILYYRRPEVTKAICFHGHTPPSGGSVPPSRCPVRGTFGWFTAPACGL